jgi:hypothetical protein
MDEMDRVENNDDEVMMDRVKNDDDEVMMDRVENNDDEVIWIEWKTMMTK